MEEESLQSEVQTPSSNEEALPTWVRSTIDQLRQDAVTYQTRIREYEEEKRKQAQEKPLEDRLEQAESRARELETRAIEAERRAGLVGQVRDVRAALKLLEEKHLDGDEVNLKALLSDYPFLRLESERPPTLPGVPVGGDINTEIVQLESRLAEVALSGKNPALVTALRSRLHELRRRH